MLLFSNISDIQVPQSSSSSSSYLPPPSSWYLIPDNALSFFGKTKIEIWKPSLPNFLFSTDTSDHNVPYHSSCRISSSTQTILKISFVSNLEMKRAQKNGGETIETHFLDIKIQRHDSWQANRHMIEDVWERRLLWDSFSHYAGVFIHEAVQGVDITRWNQVLSALMAKRLWQAHQQKASVAHHLWYNLKTLVLDPSISFSADKNRSIGTF